MIKEHCRPRYMDTDKDCHLVLSARVAPSLHSLQAGDGVLNAAKALVGVYLAAIGSWQVLLGGWLRCLPVRRLV